MRVAAVSGLGAVWGAYTPDVLDRDIGKTVGGGEAAMLETAFGLRELGHDVEVFYPGDPTVYRGVVFSPLGGAHVAVLSGNYDAVVSWSDPDIIRIAPPTVQRVYAQQLNDMPSDANFWRACDVVVPASATHGRFLARYAPPGADVAWIPLYAGVRPERYANAVKWEERGPVVSWWSSPDRGLHHLLSVWSVVKQFVPRAELRIAYHLIRFIEQSRGLLQYQDICWRARLLETLLAKTRDLDVKILGPIPRQTLAKHQGETKVWAYTFDPVCFTEGLCVSGAEAVAAGTYPLARPADALPEVFGDSIEWVGSESKPADDDFRTEFAERIIKALTAKKRPERVVEAGQQKIAAYTWRFASQNLERALTVPKGP